MTKELGLRGNERDVFAVIYSFSESCGEYTGGAQYLADRTGAARQSVCVSLKKLLQKNLIEKKERMEKGVKHCDYRISGESLSFAGPDRNDREPLREPVLNRDTSCQETLHAPVLNRDTSCQETLHAPVVFSDNPCHVSGHNNKEYNKYHNKEDNKGCEKPPQKPIRHKYGEYDNVLLTDEEAEKLKREYPDDWKERVERLSEYMASTGKRYQNHLATLRAWARKDEPKPEKKSRFADLKGGIVL